MRSSPRLPLPPRPWAGCCPCTRVRSAKGSSEQMLPLVYSACLYTKSSLWSCWPFNGKKILCSIANSSLFLLLGQGGTGEALQPPPAGSCSPAIARGHSRSHPCPAPAGKVAASGMAVAAEIPALGLSSFWQQPLCAVLLLLAWPGVWLAQRTWAKHHRRSTF